MANYYSKKQIEKAREIDLLTYLQTYEPTEVSIKLISKQDRDCTRP